MQNIVIVGGNNAVPASVESALSGYNVTRLQGDTRYETAVSIAQWEISSQGMNADNIAVATGLKFPDALAGAALCGKNNAVLVLVSDDNTTAVTDVVSAYADSISAGYVLGGTSAVSDSVMNACREATS